MTIDISRVPFSAPGAFLCVSDLRRDIWGERAGREGLTLRTAREGNSPAGVLSALTPQGEDVSFSASPALLTISAGTGEIRMAFDAEGRLRLCGRSLGLRLDFPAHTYDEFMRYGENAYYVNGARANTKLVFTVLAGEIAIDDPGLEAEDMGKALALTGEAWECVVEEYTWVYTPAPAHAPFAEVARAREADFAAYVARMGAVPARYREAVAQAAYVNYSAQVGPGGLFDARVMLMSKNWMNRVWTWDCAFNAVELAPYAPAEAWDNFASPFRHQHESGMLPDMTGDRSWLDAYTKPPIHGWALRHLREAGALDDEKRRWIYPRLLKWVESWYQYLDWDRDGVCQYNHGNDSGWDNCTYFLVGAPIEGPELSGYLTICWDELAVLAEELGLPEEAKAHRARADKQLADLVRHFWDGERLAVCQSGTHARKTDCDSLFPFLTILLGERLPKEIFAKLAQGLKEPGRFLTPYGLSTERVGDEYYVSDGYWRGPIWAPPMMFVIEGLDRGGEGDFARELAKRFCDNCRANGFAENFDAATGAGLRDRAYTWTSSVFLILAKQYLNEVEK